jgi:hypothetical protein
MPPVGRMVTGNTFHKDKSRPWISHTESLIFISLRKLWIERTITTATVAVTHRQLLPPAKLGMTKS